MDKLATLYRAAQFYAHNAHNFAHGSTFYQDHEELGGLYGTYETAYDGLVERMIGTGESFDINTVLTNAAAEAVKLPDPAAFSMNVIFGAILEIEKKFRAEIDVIYDSASTGTQNMLAQLADDSEVRSYKLQRRIMA